MKKIKFVNFSYHIILAFNLLFLFLIAASVAGPSNVYADSGNNITLTYPWSKAATPADFVSIFYKYALGLVGGAALGVLIYGAILYSVSGAVSTKEAAKKWIQGAIWGLILLLGAYLILDTINPDLVNLKNPVLEPVKLPTSTTAGAVPSGALGAPNDLAVSLQGNNNVSFSSSFNNNTSCPNYNASVTIQEIAATGLASACDSQCNCGRRVQVDPRLLQEIQTLSSNYKITVTSITTGKHEPNSRHYQGRAVDMDVSPSQRDRVLELLKSQGFNAICENGSVVTSCGAADHIHFSI